jgi:hypothetical protein
MAKTWTEFHPLITPYLPTCPLATINTYLAQVTADFFARTHLWKDEVDAIYLAPNNVEYDLDADGVEVEHVLSVALPGRKLTMVAADQVSFEHLGEVGEPRVFWLHTDNTIRVYPVPQERATMRVHAVLKPRRTATSVENWVYETWANVLASGVIAELAAIPGKDWSDMALAGMHKGKFETAINNTRVRMDRGVHMTVKMRPAA